LRFPVDTALAERDRSRLLVSASKTLDNQPLVIWRPLAAAKETLVGWVNLDFVLLGFQTCTSVARSPLR